MTSSAGKKLARSNVLFLLPNNTIIPHIENNTKVLAIPLGLQYNGEKVS